MNKYYCTCIPLKNVSLKLLKSVHFLVYLIAKIIQWKNYIFWLRCMVYSLFGQINRNLTWNRYSLTFLGQKITFERLDLIRDDTE